MRAAPLQVGYLGYPGTMGSLAWDYLIADPAVVPEESFCHYAEHIIHMPDCYLPGDSARPTSAGPGTREAQGLPADGVIYCCFNNPYKITPETYDTWMSILMEVKGSVLWISGAGDKARANLCREAQQRGVDAARVIFADRLPSIEDHLARLGTADLFLDTLPYNAHSSASDALWAGVPVLTLPGASFASRVAASQLRTAGLPELIAADREDYRRLAVELGQSPRRLAALKTKLASRRLDSPLFDTARHARNLELAYRLIHDRLHAGLPAEHLRVSALPQELCK